MPQVTRLSRVLFVLLYFIAPHVVAQTADVPFTNVSTLAGGKTTPPLLHAPAGIAIDPERGTVFVADTKNHQIKTMSTDGTVSLLAGSGVPGLADGIGRNAQFHEPAGLAFDRTNKILYVADRHNHMIRRVTLDGVVSRVAGTGKRGFANGPALAAQFDEPAALALADDGSFYVADSKNNAIRRVGADDVVTTIAGTGSAGFADGAAAAARFAAPEGIVLAANGTIIVADTGNHAIRLIAAGSVMTLAGKGAAGAVDGAASAATFRNPRGLALGDDGTLFITDSGNGLIRALKDSSVWTVSGSSERRNVTQLVDGAAGIATFDEPSAVAFAGALFIADAAHDAVRVIHPVLRIEAVVPERGPSAGGNAVRIVGSGFVPGATGQFGSVPLTGLRYERSTEITGYAPAGMGSVDVVVGSDGNTVTLTNAYTYVAPPTIAAVAPAKGPTAGGQVVTIDGSNFVDGATEVFFGPAASSPVIVESSARLTALTPEATDGTVSVTAKTEGGEATQPNAYTYLAPPAITGFLPGSGRAGTNVVLRGARFDQDPAGNVVRFSGTAALIVSAASTELIVTVPTSARTGRITVTTIGGTATSASDFVVPELRTLTVTPSSGEMAPGQTLQLRARAGFSDSSTEDVTARATWTSSTAAVASVSAGGLVIAAGQGEATISAAFEGLAAGARITVRQPNAPPPDPATIATPTDPTRPTSFADSVAFLYTGAGAIQKDVLSGMISTQRVCVIRGRAVTPAGEPLASVRVAVHGDTRFGYTLTRLDGGFDLAVNGGGVVVLSFTKDGYIPVHRRVQTPWRDFVTTDVVTMLAYDSKVTAIDLAQVQTVAVAQGSSVSDEYGTRRATLLFDAGTTASMRLANGSSQPLPSIAVRATEQTVGAAGAMPAELPPESGYTYCVELSVDEAVAAGALSVEFSKPVILYVDNFLGFRTGSIVPVGYYDRQQAEWMASANGRVIRVLSVTGGVATLDTDGDGAADDAAALAALGVDDDERRALGSLYAEGQTLWRVAVTHFTPWDCNWPYGPPETAEFPNLPEGSYNDPLEGQSCQAGSIIECESLTLGKSIPIPGTPFSLEYRSRTTDGYTAAHEITVSVTGATLPTSLKRVDLTLEVAGKVASATFLPAPNQKYTFVWDTRDAYGRTQYANRQLHVGIGFVYPGVYREPSVVGPAFGAASRGPITLQARGEIVLWQNYSIQLRGAVPDMALGGWSIDAVHAYGPEEKVLYLGTGSQIKMQARALQPKVLGQPDLGGIRAVGADGSLYVAPRCGRLVRLLPSGAVIHIAGGGATPPADGVTATQADLCVFDLTLHPTGDPVLVDERTKSIYRIRNGVLSKLVDVPTTSSSYSVAAAPEGTIYFTHQGSLKKIDGAGTVSVVLDAADNAKRSPFRSLRRVQEGANGGIYTLSTDSNESGSWYSVEKWSRSGPVAEVATGNEQLAAFVVDGNGRIYHRYQKSSFDYGVRVIEPSGVTRTVEIVPRPTVNLEFVTVTPEGNFAYVDLCPGSVSRCIYVVGSPTAAVGQNTYVAALSGDSRAFKFTASGRHTETRHSFTNALLYRMSYDAAGRILAIEDVVGRITQVVRAGDGKPIAIVAPTGERTELTLNGENQLSTILLPGNEKHSFEYTGNGLLEKYTNPRNQVSTYEYEDTGLLKRAADATGASKTLTHETTGALETVRVTTGEGHTWRYDSKRLGTWGVERTRTNPAGAVRKTSVTPALTLETAPDGSQLRIERVADPQWGSMATLTSAVFLTAPTGERLITRRARTLTLTNPNDPLSVASVTDTLKVNNRDPVTITFTTADRKIRTVSPLGRAIEQLLDTRGMVTEVRFPGLAALKVSYDTRGRLSTITRGVRSITLAWNELDRIVGITDARGDALEFGYDDAGRVATQTRTDGKVVAMEYDENGNVLSITPPGRSAHRFTYTVVDLPETYAPPTSGGASSVEFVYDKDRALRKVFAPGGVSLSFDYDTAGRLSVFTAPTFSRTYSYTGDGRVSVALENGLERLAYGWSGFLPATMTWSGTVRGTVGVAYDTDFRVSSESVSGAASVAFARDADGLLTGAGALTLARDAQSGMLTGTTLGGVTDAYTYNEYGEVATYTAAFNGTPLLQFTYTRNAAGRITGIGARGFEYDPAGRLHRVTAGGSLVAEYGYDDNGNRVGHEILRDSDLATYDAQDRLRQYGDTTFEYTEAGDLRTKTTLGQTTVFDYDAVGNLRRVVLPGGQTIEYVIDADDRRVGKKVDGTLVRGWLYLGSLTVVAELDGTNAVRSRFVYASRTNVPDYMIRDGVTYRIISDRLGSPRLVVNVSDGTIAQQLDYDEFGRVLLDTNPGFQPFGFAGGLYDTDTGFVRFGARDYDPYTGRWTTKEPLGFAGGDTNLYAYAFNDPINLSDRNGLYAFWDDLAFAAGGALIGAGGQALSDAINGEFSGWGAYGRAAAGGAAGGLATLYLGPVAGGAIGAGVTNGLNQLSNMADGTQCGFDWGSLGFDAAIGGITGKLFSAANMSAGTPRGSAAHVFKTTRTKLVNGTIAHIRPQTGWKMFVGAAEEYQMVAGTAAGVAGANGYANMNGGCGCK